MIVELPNGSKVEVDEKDAAAFERMLRKVYDKPKEKSFEQVITQANQELIEVVLKSNASVTAAIKSLKFPEFPKMQKSPEPAPPVIAVSVDEGSITHDRKTGRISGFRLVVER